jgi:hypothetical protein
MDMLAKREHPMPELAKFVAELRAAFGDTIDDAVARGKVGELTFFASENGRTVGTRAVDRYNAWVADDSVRDRYYCNGCDGSCVGTPTRCSHRP